MKAASRNGSSETEHPAWKRLERLSTTKNGLGRAAFNQPEIAKILSVSEETVKDLVKAKYLRRAKVLRKIIVPKEEIERFLKVAVV